MDVDAGRLPTRVERLSDKVLLRHIQETRVAFAAEVHRLPSSSAEEHHLFLADGTKFKSARSPDGTKQRSLRDWILADVEWVGGSALHVVRANDWYSVIVLFEGAEARFAGWHVNFQEPLRATPLGFDTRDLVIDIEVAADGAWAWRDADDFERALADGFLPGTVRQHVDVAAVRVVADIEAGRPPFDGSWQTRRPPTLPPLALRDGWFQLTSVDR